MGWTPWLRRTKAWSYFWYISSFHPQPSHSECTSQVPIKTSQNSTDEKHFSLFELQVLWHIYHCCCISSGFMCVRTDEIQLVRLKAFVKSLHDLKINYNGEKKTVFNPSSNCMSHYWTPISSVLDNPIHYHSFQLE